MTRILTIACLLAVGAVAVLLADTAAVLVRNGQLIGGSTVRGVVTTTTTTIPSGTLRARRLSEGDLTINSVELTHTEFRTIATPQVGSTGVYDFVVGAGEALGETSFGDVVGCTIITYTQGASTGTITVEMLTEETATFVVNPGKTP